MKFKIETTETTKRTYLVTAESEAEAKEILEKGEFDLILSEYNEGLVVESVSASAE